MYSNKVKTILLLLLLLMMVFPNKVTKLNNYTIKIEALY